MPKSILVADDSLTIRKVVGMLLATEDLTLTAVDNGLDAVARARELRPDLVLADCMMPGKSGYEVCQELKSDPSTAHIPVLLLAGNFEPFDPARAQACGANGHIPKPFDSASFLDRVKSSVGLPTGGGAPVGIGLPMTAAAVGAPTAAPVQPAARPAAPMPPQPHMGAQPGMPRPGGIPMGTQPGMPPRPGMPGGVPMATQPGMPPRPGMPGGVPMGTQPGMPPRPGMPGGVPMGTQPGMPPRPGMPGGIPMGTQPGARPMGVPGMPGTMPPGPGMARPPMPGTPGMPPAPGMPGGFPRPPGSGPLPGAGGVPPRRDPFGLPPQQAQQPRHESLNIDHHTPGADGGEAQLREALSKASREVIEKIAWEVVPQLAETIIRQELDRLIKDREAKGLA
ncbi:MAG: response regulator [Myxococcaceae bacterium]